MVALTLGLVAQLAIVSHAPIDTAQGVNFHALLLPDTVFVGQQATYQVGVFIDDQLRLRLRHNPEFVPPDPQGMLAYELAASARVPQMRRAGRRTYEVHVFQRAFFPLAPGRYEIPGAQLVYSLPLSMSFFSREETHTLEAESLSVVALSPPMAGRPTDYNGAVGDVTIAARLDSAAARVGDPMLLTLSVAGRGNVKLFPRPAVTVPWGSMVPGQIRVRLDTASADVRGTKEFDWLVTPRDSGVLTVPGVRYPYFDPYLDRYEIALTAPSTVHVGPGALALGDTARTDGPRPMSIRAAYRGSQGPPVYDTPEFLGLAIAAPAPALLLALRGRPKRQPRADGHPAAQLQALSRSHGPVDAATLRRAYVGALAARFTLTPTTLTSRGALSHVLRLEGVTAAAAASAESMLNMLDRGAFGSHDTIPSDLCARAYAAYREAALEARPARPAAATAPDRPAARTMRIIVLAGAVGGALVAGHSVRALLPDTSADEAREFGAGVVAYHAGHYRSAAARFAAVALLAPRAPDAWANAGTAAWAASDSVDAVVGWQHAGRLEPLAADMRDRLALVRAPQDGPIARLPRLPASLAGAVALGWWVVACAIAAWRASRRRSVFAAAPVACVLAACAAAAVGVRVDEASAARDLAVVDRGAALYASPALDADRGPRVDAGDVAQSLARQGLWTRVRLDSDREGWVESARLIPLGTAERRREN